MAVPRGMPAKTRPRAAETGLSLIEVLVTLVLFSLIGLAGVGVLQALVRVEARTDGRLERLSDLHRAYALIRQDIEQATGDALVFEGDGILFKRLSGKREESAATGDLMVRYSFRDDAIYRHSRHGLLGETRDVSLIDRVGAVRWSFFTAETGWSEAWPPQERPETPPPLSLAPRPPLPKGIKMELDLKEEAGLAGTLTRVFVFPRPSAEGAL